jgi:hypothetical protein
MGIGRRRNVGGRGGPYVFCGVLPGCFVMAAYDLIPRLELMAVASL